MTDLSPTQFRDDWIAQLKEYEETHQSFDSPKEASDYEAIVKTSKFLIWFLSDDQITLTNGYYELDQIQDVWDEWFDIPANKACDIIELTNPKHSDFVPAYPNAYPKDSYVSDATRFVDVDG